MVLFKIAKYRLCPHSLVHISNLRSSKYFLQSHQTPNGHSFGS